MRLQLGGAYKINISGDGCCVSWKHRSYLILFLFSHLQPTLLNRIFKTNTTNRNHLSSTAMSILHSKSISNNRQPEYAQIFEENSEDNTVAARSHHTFAHDARVRVTEIKARPLKAKLFYYKK